MLLQISKEREQIVPENSDLQFKKVEDILQHYIAVS